MRITPVSNYNYTNQKVQRNNNQPSFGMIIAKESLIPFIEKVSLKGPETLDAFESALNYAAEKLGRITHKGQQIVAKIELSKENVFFVHATCDTGSGVSDHFSGALGNTADDGKNLAYRLELALKQAAHKANPERNICDERIASSIADAIAKHDPTLILSGSE